MNYNNIEKYNELHIPSEYVVIESLNIKDDPDNPGFRIAPQERIVPQKEIFHNGKSYVICCVESTTRTLEGKEEIILDNGMHFTKANAWRLILRRGVPLDEKRYKYLMLSPQNQNNVLGLDVEPFAFRVVDDNKDAEMFFEKEKEEIEFRNKIVSLTDKAAIEIAKNLGLAEDNPTTAKTRLLTLAKNNMPTLKAALLAYSPTAPTTAQIDPANKLATIEKAFNLKKIKFNREDGVVSLNSFGKAHLFKVADEEGNPKDIDLEEFADEISNEAYEKILQSFKGK
jgi:hypothetical protein